MTYYNGDCVEGDFAGAGGDYVLIVFGINDGTTPGKLGRLMQVSKVAGKVRMRRRHCRVAYVLMVQATCWRRGVASGVADGDDAEYLDELAVRFKDATPVTY